MAWLGSAFKEFIDELGNEEKDFQTDDENPSDKPAVEPSSGPTTTVGAMNSPRRLLARKSLDRHERSTTILVPSLTAARLQARAQQALDRVQSQSQARLPTLTKVENSAEPVIAQVSPAEISPDFCTRDLAADDDDGVAGGDDEDTCQTDQQCDDQTAPVLSDKSTVALADAGESNDDDSSGDDAWGTRSASVQEYTEATDSQTPLKSLATGFPESKVCDSPQWVLAMADAARTPTEGTPTEGLSVTASAAESVAASAAEVGRDNREALEAEAQELRGKLAEALARQEKSDQEKSELENKLAHVDSEHAKLLAAHAALQSRHRCLETSFEDKCKAIAGNCAVLKEECAQLRAQAEEATKLHAKNQELLAKHQSLEIDHRELSRKYRILQAEYDMPKGTGGAATPRPKASDSGRAVQLLSPLSARGGYREVTPQPLLCSAEQLGDAVRAAVRAELAECHRVAQTAVK